MATTATSVFNLPNHLASGVWSGVQTLATVPALSGQEPMLFGTTQYMKFTSKPKAEFVAEGAVKGQSNPGITTVTAVPRKAVVQSRFNDEVQWADEDYRLDVLTSFTRTLTEALARALDLGIYHGINPKTGVLLSGSPTKIVDTTNSVEITTTSKPSDDVLTAAGLLIADGYTPNGIALDPSFGFKLATEKDSSNRRVAPELGLGTNLTGYMGMNAAVSTTVSAPEATISGGAYATTNPNVKALVGDFSALRWGVQRNIGVERIIWGNPDNDAAGDLKGSNQFVLRAEIVYGWAVMDTNAFAKIIDATA